MIMKQVDTNGSGVIDYTEFVVATISRKSLLSKERMEAAFKMIDKDGSGYLELKEIKDLFNPGNEKNKFQTKCGQSLFKKSMKTQTERFLLLNLRP